MFHSQQQIGPYILVRLLGQGGFGEVWLAEKRGALMTTQVAVKLPLDPDPDLDAIRHEAQTWLRASGHPNVLPVIEADIYDEQVMIVSEYAAGGSLASWLKQHGGKAPSVEAAVSMASGILAGLEHLHHLATPIVHRDLKPDNVLLQGGLPRLTDFGISRVLKTTAQTQHSSGTPHYMPPEAFAGKYSPQSDVWAAGVMLYQMLSGTLPFPQSDMPSLYGAILTGSPPSLPADVPAHLRKAVMSALEKDPARRPQSAAALRVLLNQSPSQAAPAHSLLPQNNLPQNNKSAPSNLSSVPQTAPLPRNAGLPQTGTADAAAQELKKRREISRRNAIAGIVATSLITAYPVKLWLSHRDDPAKHIPHNNDPSPPPSGNVLLSPDLTLAGHGDNVNAVAISVDGTRIVTGSGDDAAKVWDAQTGKELQTLRGHTRSINSVVIANDGKRIVTGSGDKTAKIWDAETGKELLTLKGHTEMVSSVALSSDGRRIVTGSFDTTAKIWDAANGQELTTLKETEAISSVAIAADGRHIVTGSRDASFTNDNSHTAKVWDAATGQELLTLTGHTNNIYSVAISADGMRIVTGSGDKTAKVWDAETGKELLTLRGHADAIYSVAIAADNRRIVTGSRDNTAKVWDAETGQELLTLKAADVIYSVALSADGKRIVTGSGDKTAKVWTLPPNVAGGAVSGASSR